MDITYPTKDKNSAVYNEKYFTDGDANMVKQAVNSKAEKPVQIPFTSAIPFNKSTTYLGEHPVSGPLVLTKNIVGAVPGYGAIVRLIANGVNIPDVSAFTVVGDEAYDNTDGNVTALYFMFDGGDYVLTYVPMNAPAGNVTPTAPSAGVVNDVANTFDWTENPTYPSIADYEYTMNGGSSYSDVVAKPLAVGNIDKAIGQVGVRIKAATGRNVSATLFNTSPFTMSGTQPAAPTSGVVDDVANTFDFTYNPAFTNVTDYEYTLDGGTSYANLAAKPLVVGNVNKAIGQVGVRVKAVGINPASTTLYNASAFNVTVSLRGDVSTYITNEETRSGLTVTTGRRNAINSFIQVLDDNSWLPRLAVGRFMVGSAQLNFVNPIDTDAAFRASWLGGTPTIDLSTGVNYDGTNGANLFYNHFVDGGPNPNDEACHMFIINGAAGGTPFGAISVGGHNTYFFSEAASTNASQQINGGGTNPAIDTRAGRFIYNCHTEAGVVKRWVMKNGVVSGAADSAIGSGLAPNMGMFEGGLQNDFNPISAKFTGSVRVHLIFKTGFSVSERTTLDAAFSNLQAGLV